MAGDFQASNEQATRNGIQALESAYSGVVRIRQDVDGIRSGLKSGYQGGDGGAFGELLGQWDAQATVITDNLRSMVDTLNATLREHNLRQGASNDSINQAFSDSQAIFDELTS